MTDGRERQREGGGGIVIGRMTGGAAASGEGARAEDRSERVSGPAPARADGPARVPAGAAPGEGGIAIAEMEGGAAAAGRDAEAVDSSRQLIAATPELLAAVRSLRQETAVAVRAPGDGIAEVDAELGELEEEAWQSGSVRRGRLARLRSLLTGGAAAAGALASAAEAAETISRLLA